MNGHFPIIPLLNYSLITQSTSIAWSIPMDPNQSVIKRMHCTKFLFCCKTGCFHYQNCLQYVKSFGYYIEPSKHACFHKHISQELVTNFFMKK